MPAPCLTEAPAASSRSPLSVISVDPKGQTNRRSRYRDHMTIEVERTVVPLGRAPLPRALHPIGRCPHLNERGLVLSAQRVAAGAPRRRKVRDEGRSPLLRERRTVRHGILPFPASKRLVLLAKFRTIALGCWWRENELADWMNHLTEASRDAAAEVAAQAIRTIERDGGKLSSAWDIRGARICSVDEKGPRGLGIELRLAISNGICVLSLAEASEYPLSIFFMVEGGMNVGRRHLNPRKVILGRLSEWSDGLSTPPSHDLTCKAATICADLGEILRGAAVTYDPDWTTACLWPDGTTRIAITIASGGGASGRPSGQIEFNSVPGRRMRGTFRPELRSQILEVALGCTHASETAGAIPPFNSDVAIGRVPVVSVHNDGNAMANLRAAARLVPNARLHLLR